MNGHQIAWYCVVSLFVAVAAVAIVFAILAWTDGQARRPHQSVERCNIVARGDMFTDGNLHTRNDLCVEQNCQIRGKARLSRLGVSSLAFDGIEHVTESTVLSRTHSVYRVDLPGSQVIPLYLPAAADAPLQVFIVMVSRPGAGNTVQIYLSPGDALSNASGTTTTNPAYSLPIVPNSADMVILVSDALSTWFASAHTL